MKQGTVIGRTESLCPICLILIEANKVAYDDGIYMEKHCPEHGDFRVLIWRGSVEQYTSWNRASQFSVPTLCQTKVEKQCPYDCGLCEEHRQKICCVLLEVTQRCNLSCPVCFASAGDTQKEPSLEQISFWYDNLMEAGGPFNIQLSGGEPTMRDDLPAIIELGKQKGFTFFQLNTNGIRLAKEPEYVQQLAAAGLNCVFLQFDGVNDKPYEVLRGKPLLSIKLNAIDHCHQAGIGVVLVPTIAPDVNVNEIGAILQFALDHMPGVRGVHIQPISYFGRCALKPTEQRLTIPEVLEQIEQQTHGLMKVQDFIGGGAENSYCSFHGNFMRLPDGTIRVVKSNESSCCTSSKQSREFVAKRWSGAPLNQKVENNCCCSDDHSNEQCNTSYLDQFLERIENYTLAVSGMLFQDAWNLDLERLKSCYLCEVSPDGRTIPFCAYNLTDAQGNTLYRGKS